MTIWNEMQEFAKNFQNLLLDIQRCIVDIQVRTFNYEEHAKEMYEKTQKYVEQIDNFIIGGFQQPNVDEEKQALLIQFMVSFKPQLDTYREQLHAAISSPPPEFQFNDEINEQLKATAEKATENKEETKEEKKEDEEESYEEENDEEGQEKDPDDAILDEAIKIEAEIAKMAENPESTEIKIPETKNEEEDEEMVDDLEQLTPEQLAASLRALANSK